MCFLRSFTDRSATVNTYNSDGAKVHRADEASGLYQALNRGNLRAEIFKKEADYAAFQRILHEGLKIQEVKLNFCQLMSNQDHLFLRPLVGGEMSRLMDWVGGTHTMSYHAHYLTSGMRHVYQQRYATRAFRFKTTNTSSWSVDMSNGTRCGLVVLTAQRVGVGDRRGDGSKNLTPFSCLE